MFYLIKMLKPSLIEASNIRTSEMAINYMAKYVNVLGYSKIFSEDYINKTNKIFNVGLSKIFKFLGFTLFPFALNTYSIINKWIGRPERDQNEFHNWSLLSVIHIEFAGLVFMLSNLSTNLFMLLFSYYIRIEDDLDSYYSYYLNLKILSLVALFYFFAKILIIDIDALLVCLNL